MKQPSRNCNTSSEAALTQQALFGVAFCFKIQCNPDLKSIFIFFNDLKQSPNALLFIFNVVTTQQSLIIVQEEGVIITIVYRVEKLHILVVKQLKFAPILEEYLNIVKVTD